MKITPKLVLLFVILIASGCHSGRKEWTPKDWHTIEIDGCQYIESSKWNDIPLIHKGNCKNPIHKP
jgi:hypothetical protein